jgi:hypothetical protein
VPGGVYRATRTCDLGERRERARRVLVRTPLVIETFGVPVQFVPIVVGP